LPTIFFFLFAFCYGDLFGLKEERRDSISMENALDKLRMPGIRLNLQERCVDVNATVCLREGLLELVVCTEDTKEHESIVVMNARPIQVHTALLLMGARPGTPAMKRVVEGEVERWISVPPAGDPIEVSLVFPDGQGQLKEHPINQFVAPALLNGNSEPNDEKKPSPFSSLFLFTGSHLLGSMEGPRKYACEFSGNVISVSTFGDELLCLPGIHGHQNDGLAWKVNPQGLPELGTKVVLRLRPKLVKHKP